MYLQTTAHVVFDDFTGINKTWCVRLGSLLLLVQSLCTHMKEVLPVIIMAIFGIPISKYNDQPLWQLYTEVVNQVPHWENVDATDSLC